MALASHSAYIVQAGLRGSTETHSPGPYLGLEKWHIYRHHQIQFGACTGQRGMNPGQRPLPRIYVFNHWTERRELLRAAGNPGTACGGADQLQSMRQERALSPRHEGLVLAHPRALAARQNEPGYGVHAVIIHAPAARIPRCPARYLSIQLCSNPVNAGA